MLVAIAPAVLALAISVPAVPNPRHDGGWVADLAEVLSDGDEAALDEIIGALNDDLSVEIAVVTVPDIDGTPKEFATELFNTWGIGQADANNGLLVLLVLGQRRLEMETGYGLESSLPDGWLGAMQQRSMVPLFKQGEFGSGLVAGVSAVDSRLRQRPEEAIEGAAAPASVRPARAAGEARSSFGGSWAWGLLGLLGILGLLGLRFLWVLASLIWWKRCPECDSRREHLDEDAEDEHLSEGQQTEESVGSVNYDVFVCMDCGSVGVRRDGKLFSRFSSCKQCGFKTVRRTSETLKAATQYSTGTARITVSCRNCSMRESYTRRIPKRSPPSSSSSSSSTWSGSSGSSWSSGGFSGGSSGGGGAGSSW
jgi:uncharacterized protein